MVFDRYPAGGGEMLLALALADHAHDDGTNIYPSVNHLSIKTRQSERTIQYQLRKMEECGWLVLVADEKGGRGKAREYRINREWLKGAEIAPFIKGATDDIKGATDDIKGATDDIKGAIAVAPESSITIIEPSITINKPSVQKCTEFDLFWNAYPNKTGKQDALKKWLKIKPPLQKIISALTWQKESQQWQQGYIPNPATYLNQHRWEDEPKPDQVSPMTARQQQVAIAARSVFGNDNNEKCIDGEVINYGTTAKQLG